MKSKISINETFFVAGASGMAGSAICRSLRNKGYGCKDKGGKLLTPTRKDLDLLSYESVINWFDANKPTVVIIAAAKVGGIYANSTFPADFLLENIKIQTNIIEAAWKTNVKRLLFLGSSCIYPKNILEPINEEFLLSGPLEKTNEQYAIAKIAGIKLCESLSKQYNLDAISLMPTNLYGPGDNYDSNNSHVMAAMIKRFSEAKKLSLKSVTCWGSGNPLREFLYVDDLGDAVVFALEKWDPKSKSAPLDNHGNPLFYLNVGTGKDIKIEELAKKIARYYEYYGQINWDIKKPDGTKRKVLDVKRLNSLGWQSKTSLDEGLKKTIISYKNLK
ncbi:GDP-L-fucose synthase [Prochlorococcus sp. MIT 0604]|uniref:GDP-L-fucose synthase family protein n=1 Tax=Prochlorococcus sp. MIT 0604 TaxID=1501268 RepID=UPI0004F72DBD|nr:GDP-L-fucose synthase [Prochlorococcus sp. MIT 0604]AIQ95490.1 GDP-L-fucose synthetase [Prochlorococcus sp. MIT 0604]